MLRQDDCLVGAIFFSLTFGFSVQVVIARVISIDHDGRRLRLSLAPKTGNTAAETAAGDPAGALHIGDLVEGIVASITSKEVQVQAWNRLYSHSVLPFINIR